MWKGPVEHAIRTYISEFYRPQSPSKVKYVTLFFCLSLFRIRNVQTMFAKVWTLHRRLIARVQMKLKMQQSHRCKSHSSLFAVNAYSFQKRIMQSRWYYSAIYTNNGQIDRQLFGMNPYLHKLHAFTWNYVFNIQEAKLAASNNYRKKWIKLL